MPKLVPRRRRLRKSKRKKRHPNWKERKWLQRQLLTREGGLCIYCNEQVNLIHDDPKQATLDHVLPVSKGGLTKLDNLVLACAECNAEKGDGVDFERFLEPETEPVV
jgi:5-methylcytosine-specific restriction endonuclease McrA